MYLRPNLEITSLKNLGRLVPCLEHTLERQETCVPAKLSHLVLQHVKFSYSLCSTSGCRDGEPGGPVARGWGGKPPTLVVYIFWVPIGVAV